MPGTLRYALIALLLAASVRARSFEPYQVIIDRQPFGAIASDPATAQTEPSAEFVATEEVQQLASKLVMSAMTVTPEGQSAVGITDSSTAPAVSHLLVLGDPPVNGLQLDLVDFEGKVATFSKGGVTFSLKLGTGIVETLTAESLAALEQKRLEEAAAATKPRYNSLAEQLIAMQMSVGPDVEAPPLPIISGDIASLTKPFDPERVPEEATTETDHLVNEGVKEMIESARAGETPQQYLERLQAHQKAEAARQQKEKAIARAAEKELLKNAQTEEDEARIRRRMNIELLKKNVTPLEPIELTPEEAQEIRDAGGNV